MSWRDLARFGEIKKEGHETYTYSNATTNTATSPANYGVNNMTETLTNSLGIRFATNIPAGSPAFLRFFLNISGGQPAGIYSNSVIFQAVATGTSVTCASATPLRRVGAS